MSERRFGHRPALDGVRALAVAAVVAYHFGVDRAAGGFLGVDVFFVVSGYLITTLLLLEHGATGRIDLRAFWARRARRLLPALAVVVVGAGVWVWLTSGPDGGAGPGAAGGWSSFRADALATLGYAANWRFVFGHQGYFAAFADPSPLRHTWSLAIEEQWYLVWPLALWGLLVLAGRVRGGRSRARLVVGVAVGGAALASAALMAATFVPGTDPSRAYYGTDTRAQALLVGALLAVVLVRRAARTPAPAVPRWLGPAGGLAAVALAATMATTMGGDARLYRGGFLAVAVLAAVVVAAATEGAGATARVLAARPLVWVGERSYGIYLWHWPVVVALSPARTGLDGWALAALRLAVTVVLVVASYRGIEQPVRRGRVVIRQPVRAGAAVAAAFAGVAVLVAVVPAPGPGSAAAANLAALSPTGTPPGPVAADPQRGSPAPAATGGPRPAVATPPTGSVPTAAAGGGRPAVSAAASSDSGPASSGSPPAPPPPGHQVMVVGDSTAQQFASGGAPAPLPGWHVTAQARLGCGLAQGNPWSDRAYIPAGDDCHQWPAEWQAAIAAVRPDVVVVMVGAWEVLDHRVDGQVLRFGTPAWDQVVGDALDLAVAVAGVGGTPVIAMTVPCFRQASTPVIDTTDRNDGARVARTNALLATAVAGVSGARLADYGGHVCPGGRYTERLDGVEMRPDGVHLGPDGARAVWAWLAPTLAAAVGR